jgi:hypothetical protein
MLNRKRIKILRLVSICALLLAMTLLITDRSWANPDSEVLAETALRDFLQETFEDFFYHGVYVDPENDYLVISLKIHPGRLAKKMKGTGKSIDEILALTLIEDLYEQRFSYYLFGAPRVKGVSIILTWEDCRRVKKRKGKEKLLMKEGRFEFDRFDVSRSLYFDKLAMVQSIPDPLSAGKLFDSIAFSHIEGDSYRGEPFHTTSVTP